MKGMIGGVAIVSLCLLAGCSSKNSSPSCPDPYSFERASSEVEGLYDESANGEGFCGHLVANVKPGDVIRFGSYPQRKCVGSEPIEWIVLDSSDKGVLVVSKYILDAAKYHETFNDVTWENSTIRSWLNGYDGKYNKVNKSYAGEHDSFIKMAFNENERNCIIDDIEVENVKHPEFDSVSAGGNTKDKIFLLSFKDVDKSLDPGAFFGDNYSPNAYATDYARDRGLHVKCSKSNDKKFCSSGWWLRSPGAGSEYAGCVSVLGGVKCFEKVDEKVGVRPALRLGRN